MVGLAGAVEVELVCEPVFDYGRVPAEWSLSHDGRHIADASGAGRTIRLATDMEVGVEGDRVRARHMLREGERIFCSLAWREGLASPVDVHDAERRIAATTTFWARTAGARPHEKLLRVASPLGLYAEEFDTGTGRHLGNFPQAFSHLALIEAAGLIILVERLEELA